MEKPEENQKQIIIIPENVNPKDSKEDNQENN